MRCIVCHDAGGAEVLASYAAHQGGDWLFVLDGPAGAIFERRLGTIVNTPFDTAIAMGSWFLTGSSWQSDLEWRAISKARRVGKPVITFLDHWVNYRERFVRNGIECLPDSIWVGDVYALERARDLFQETDIRLVVNPYIEDVTEELARCVDHHRSSESVGMRVLFVCEPISEHAEKAFGDPRYWGYTEFDALRFFHSCRSLLGGEIASLVIRPHPAERPEKYLPILQEWAGVACLGGKTSLTQEIMAADVVVGCATMAMVVGLLAKKRVYCAIPPGGVACSLPHKEIEYLSVIAGKTAW